jgi:hypothetical protein
VPVGRQRIRDDRDAQGDVIEDAITMSSTRWISSNPSGNSAPPMRKCGTCVGINPDGTGIDEEGRGGTTAGDGEDITGGAGREGRDAPATGSAAEVSGTDGGGASVAKLGVLSLRSGARCGDSGGGSAGKR